MKVRVPQSLRPPKRFEAFKARTTGGGKGVFKVKGVYRLPRRGEWFWSSDKYAECAPLDFKFTVRVILERVS